MPMLMLMLIAYRICMGSRVFSTEASPSFTPEHARDSAIERESLSIPYEIWAPRQLVVGHHPNHPWSQQMRST